MTSSKQQTDPSLEADPQALVGRTIRNRYRVESLLGTGGMGAVYRVIHTGIDKPMALKVLSARMMQNPTVIARFEREAKAAANFNHPNVVSSTDYGRTDDGRFYLVLEYVDGKELRQAMDDVDGPLPPVRAFFIARQIASALSRASKMGVVHRDLKPENIMLVSSDGHHDFVKVLDFGLALISRHLNTDVEDEQRAMTAPKITAVGEIFGTPSYMAPEQTVGGTTDTRTDLYALGIILYEMLTGLRPFVGKNPVALIQQQLATPPPPMKDRAPNVQVAKDMEALVMRLLAKQPADRYQTPEELIAAIDQIGAAHNLNWPGRETPPSTSSSENADDVTVPGGPGFRRSLGSVRALVSKGVDRDRTRIDAPPDKGGGSGLRWFGVLVLLLIVGSVFFYVTRMMNGTLAPSDEEPQKPAVTEPEPAPSGGTDPDSAPSRREKGKHRGGRGDRSSRP